MGKPLVLSKDISLELNFMGIQLWPALEYLKLLSLRYILHKIW